MLFRAGLINALASWDAAVADSAYCLILSKGWSWQVAERQRQRRGGGGGWSQSQSPSIATQRHRVAGTMQTH